MGDLRSRIAKLEGVGLGGVQTPRCVLIRVTDHRPGPIYSVDVGQGHVKRPQGEDEEAFTQRVAAAEYERMENERPGQAHVIIMHLSRRPDPLPRLENSYRVIELDEQDRGIEQEQNGGPMPRHRGRSAS